jgi:hypothetical protein
MSGSERALTSESDHQSAGLDENVSRTYNADLSLASKRCQWRKSSPTRLIRPALCCFLKAESRNLNHLILIRFRLALATRAGASPREAPAIRTAGPRGIRNPRRRVPDLVTRPLSAQALSDLLDRKPHLLRPLVLQLLPPPLAPIDPAERLGIDLSSLRTVEDFRELLPTILAAIARGEIAPAEGARIARRVRARLRAIRRLARLASRAALHPACASF